MCPPELDSLVADPERHTWRGGEGWMMVDDGG